MSDKAYYCGGIRDQDDGYYVEVLNGSWVDNDDGDQFFQTSRGMYEKAMIGKSAKEAVEKFMTAASLRVVACEHRLRELEVQRNALLRELEDARGLAQGSSNVYSLVGTW